MELELLERNMFHLLVGGVVLDPVLVFAPARARMQDRAVLVGHHRQFIEPAAGQFSMRSKCGRKYSSSAPGT